MINKSPDELFDYLRFLFDRYSSEYRAMTLPHRLTQARERIPEFAYSATDTLVRESLMEHVGSLPVIATALYPYIGDDRVDLGRALVMLAIHDIGELITHDEMTFIKKADGKAAEREAARSLLHPDYHDIYDEVESCANVTAQFAKSIDKLAPELIEYFSPADVTRYRYWHFLGLDTPDAIITLLEEKKRPYMEWNPFLTEFHKELLARLHGKLAAANRR